jgi:hypothetical protein
MSLDIWAKRRVVNKQQILDLIEKDSLKNKIESVLDNEVFSMNITSNLDKMAKAAGFYQELWHLSGIKTCEDLLPYIEAGLGELKMKPNVYKQYSASNGWGTYEQFIDWLEKLISNLKIDPKAELHTSF